MFGRLVGSVVTPVVDSVDVDEVVERIDVNHLMERLDLDELIDRIDIDQLMQRVDINALLARVDVNELVGRIELDQLMQRVDIDALMARVDVGQIVDRIDVDAMIGRVDVDGMIGRVDVDAMIGRVDVDGLIGRVDVDGVIGRVDVDGVIGRVDVDAMIDRVDVDRMMGRVDVNSIVERTEIGAIIARSTTGVFTQLLDVARTQLIAVDQVAQAVPARLLRGEAREVPPKPSGPSDVRDLQSMSLSQRAIALQRHAAGSISRFLAFLLDQFLIGILFAGGLVLTTAALQVVIGVEFSTDDDSLLIALGYVTWAFLYTAGSLAATGRTIGKAVLGLLVVEANGDGLTGRAAVVRTLMFPLSFFLFGIGFLLGLIRRDRRELHDLIGGTAVIYAWDATTAQLRVQAADTPAEH